MILLLCKCNHTRMYSQLALKLLSLLADYQVLEAEAD